MFSVKSVFKFLSTPKACGHYIVTDIIYSRIIKVFVLYIKVVVTLPIVISPHLASPEGQPILTFPKGRNKLLCQLSSAPT